MGMFHSFELDFLNFIYSMHNPFLDKLMMFITHLGDAGMLWIVLGLLFCTLKKYRKAGICILIALLINLLIGNIILKPLVARIRPYEYSDFVKLLIPMPSDFSFPSGHSFSSFAASVSLLLYHKKEGICFIIIASLIAFSRLYIYVHFPSDVIAGIIFGILVAFVSRRITEKLFSRFAL